MKNVKNFLFSLVLIPALAIGFNSCKDDDDDADTDYAAEIAGSYKGTISSLLLPEDVDNVVITVTRDAENHVVLAMTQNVMEIPISITCSSDVSTDGKSSINGKTAIDLSVETLLPVALAMGQGQITEEQAMVILVTQLGEPQDGIFKDVPVTVKGTMADLTISVSSFLNLKYAGTKQ